jgi:hypothetical protein
MTTSIFVNETFIYCFLDVLLPFFVDITTQATKRFNAQSLAKSREHQELALVKLGFSSLLIYAADHLFAFDVFL